MAQTSAERTEQEAVEFRASTSIRRKVVVWGVLAMVLALVCAWLNTPVTWALAVPNVLLALAMLVLYWGVLRRSAIFQYRDGTLEMGAGPFAESYISLSDIESIEQDDATGLVTLHGERLGGSVTLPVNVLAEEDRTRLLALIDRHR
jgi:hypothetical protein